MGQRVLIHETNAYLLLLAGAAFAGRAVGIATVRTGVRLLRPLFYRGQHRPRLTPLEEEK